jgi:hypothetical protein
VAGSWVRHYGAAAVAAAARRIGAAPPLLALALLLPPPAAGGTSLAGLPNLCGFHYLSGGLSCPGCGITRAVVCCAHGLWTEAVAFHPLGPVVFAALLGVSVVRLGNLPVALPPWTVASASWAGVFALAAVWGARLAGWMPGPP